MSELDLPEGMTYRAGDYLAVYALLRSRVPAHLIDMADSLPTNPDRVVRRAIARFGLSIEQEVRNGSRYNGVMGNH